ncbi:type II secretion system protein [Candidatus Uhrbacteria bacterium]|nr:type II secretion system protein [Candidatus Uhrbacteria bacterium]
MRAALPSPRTEHRMDERAHPSGFTLMELVVAIAVFTVTMGFTIDLFLSAIRQQSRVTVASTLQADARFVFEMIAGELRDGTIDYSRAATAEEFSIRRSDNRVVVFRRSSTDCPASVASCVQIGRFDPSGVLAWAPLTGLGITADVFDVLVQPTENPFSWDASQSRYRSNVQPRVTVHLRFSAPTGRAGELLRVEGQSTLTSRMYQR